MRKYILTTVLCFCLGNKNAVADFQETLPVQNPLPLPATPPPQKQPQAPAHTLHTQRHPSTTPPSASSDLMQHNANAPVYFQGNSADGSRKTGVINLIGAVVIIQDDVKLTSDKAQIITVPNSSVPLSGSTALQKAIATGNVHVDKMGGPQVVKAEADKIEFLIPEGIMLLTGNAKVKKGQELINASTMSINMKNGDIKLQDPHGTIDPLATTNQFNKKTDTVASGKN